MWAFLIAVAATTSLVASLQWWVARAPISVVVSFEDAAFADTPDLTRELGGPLTPAEIDVIKQVSSAEVERALSGLRVRLTTDPRAFWRVRVVPSVIWRSLTGRARLNAAGASWGFGPLGGAAFVNFNTLALNAVRYAPLDTSRQEIVEAIGRGIGRSAVHELAHMIARGAEIHNATDELSYEYRTADRAAQYYGDMRWANAWPVLQARIGR